MTTIDTVSLATLWQRWQELEEDTKRQDAGDKEIFAEFNEIEKQIIDRPADNPPDLKAKLKFLAHIARDHDWDDHLEKLYASIEAGFEKALFAGYQIVCDFDAEMRMIESMTRALSIFTLAEDVWNDTQDAVAAQALIFKITDSCKSLRDMHSELADLLRGERRPVPHPIVEMMAERTRIVSETNASPLAGAMTGDAAFDALVDAAGKRIAEIDEQIADMVTTNADGLAAQVELLDVLGGDQFGLDVRHSDDCSVRLSASIKRGIRRLHDRGAS